MLPPLGMKDQNNIQLEYSEISENLKRKESSVNILPLKVNVHVFFIM